MTSSVSHNLSFSLNGELIELNDIDPSITLNEFIRTKTRFKGTKLSCGEGGCGACVVLVARYDPKQKLVIENSINSCLSLLCSLDGCAITTTEGIGSSKSPNGFHSIQKRMAGFHASQCGFCTPGMTMAIYSTLRKSLQNTKFSNNSYLSQSSLSAPKTSTILNGTDNTAVEIGTGITAESSMQHKLTTLPNLSISEAEASLCGNICRCTGYRPILDVCRSFSGDLDIEDLSNLGINTFGKDGRNHITEFDQLPPYDISKDPSFPPQLIQRIEERGKGERQEGELGLAIDWKSSNHSITRQWRTANSLLSVFSLLEEMKEETVKLVIGNTSAGIYKDENPTVYIDIQNVTELNEVKLTYEGLTVGTSIRINHLIEILEQPTEHSHSSDHHQTVETQSTVNGQVFHALANHLRKLASPHVRNSASIGGNLILAQQRGFESDLATILLGAGAKVTVASLKKGERTLSMDEFLSSQQVDHGEILLRVFIPSWNLPSSFNHFDQSNRETNRSSMDSKLNLEENDKIIFQTYRTAIRPLGNAHAFANSAFLICLNESSNQNQDHDQDQKSLASHFTVKYARLAFGAFGCKHAVRATSAEKYLTGKTITTQTLSEIIRLTKTEIIPLHETRKAEYRSSLIISFLFSFFSEYIPSVLPKAVDFPSFSHKTEQNGFHIGDKNETSETNVDKNGISNGELSDVGEKTIKSKENSVKARGKQRFEFSKEHFPVSEPVKKVGAEHQSSGEAVYVDDIPTPPRCAFAAIVSSKVPCGKILTIDFSDALLQPGVVGYYDVREDSPAGGKNIGFEFFDMYSPLFAENEVEFVGHPIALMVADSYKNAKAAAEKVKIEYDVSQSEPMITIEDAEKRNSYFPMLPFVSNLIPKTGNFEEEFAKSEYKIESEVFLNSQQHFYLEQQSAMAIPDEQNTVTIYSSTQSPDNIQKVISACLNIPRHSVRVITRRLGGGFGGKATRSSQVAAACALAAKKFDQPVKMCLDLNTDMALVGGRHHTRARYSVGFSSDGKINCVKVEARMNGGYSMDASSWIPLLFGGALVQYAWGALSIDVKVCRTNISCKTAVRGPGEIQGCYVAETIIEHVANILNKPTDSVRETNMLTPQYLNQLFPNTLGDDVTAFTLPRVWNQLKEKAKFEQRSKEVMKFNEKNRWKKRGLSIVPCTYKVSVWSRPARVSIYSDMSVVIEQGGVEMGQGLLTKVQQTAMYGLNTLWKAQSMEKENGKDEVEGNGKSMIDLSRIRVVDQDTISLPHGGVTGGSTTSESSCESVRLACAILVDRLRPVKEKLKNDKLEGKVKEVTWESILKKASEAKIELSAQILPQNLSFSYFNFGAAVSEVEIDALTGQTTILQSDLIYDCGKSLNPAIDIGQIEGAFIQGVGFFTTEEVVVNEAGRLVSNGTWEYKPPTFDTIPRVLNVDLLHSSPNKKGIQPKLLESPLFCYPLRFPVL